ncbi:MAG: signal recognition particle-docking protein FtsY [Idiomarina sp.]|nr:signal recognition particle-docking protein FtsY [Idiomarina sp.]
MAKKRSFLSSLFGGKNDDAAADAQHENDPQQNEKRVHEEQAEQQHSEAAAQDTDKPDASETLPKEGTDLPSAVDDAAAMQSRTTPSASAVADSQTELSATAQPSEATAERPEKKGWWQRLRDGLKKTSSSLGSGLADLFVGKQIDDELFEDLETQLLMADVGVETTAKIIDELTAHASRKELQDAELLYTRLKEFMAEMLEPVNAPLVIDNSNGPFVILMVGVNGVGKTTTIGKLAQQFQSEGKSVMLAAGDTFRAAAVEQLQVWGERNSIPVIAQHTGADSASVIFDAVQAAKARGVDVLIADTAGRLQNKANLMEELKKIVRVMKKLDENMPHEVLLTLDAGTGQNAISQAKIFNEAVGVSGLAMTKLDGTAKGGVIFALANQFKIPIRYIGVGESLHDLRPFVAHEFVDALFTDVLADTAKSSAKAE